MPCSITPPYSPAWSLDVETTADGIALVLVIALAGQETVVKLGMDRPDSRRFGHAILAAGGDALARTFIDDSRARGGREP